jgi:hypothetical protein
VGSIPLRAPNLLIIVETVMIENTEFAGDYARQMISTLKVEQRKEVFEYLETFFDKSAIETMKSDTLHIVEERAEMDRRLAELDVKRS